MTALNASGVAPVEPSVDEPQIIDLIFVSGIAQAKVIGGLLYLAMSLTNPENGRTASGSSRPASSCRLRP